MSLPLYPKFTWDEFFWVTSANLPSWSGFQIRNGPYGALSSNDKSTGVHQLLFAPEGRGEDPLNKNELQLVKWVIDNEKPIHNAMLDALFKEYPSIVKEFSEFLDEDADELLPTLNAPSDIKNIVGVVSINIHQIFKNKIPYFGIELGCTWDEEHGAGLLLHGTHVLEVGNIETAGTLWMAEKYAEKS